MKKSWIDNKTIVITGASSGIGRELARLFLENNNAKVIGVGRSEKKMLEFKSTLGAFADNFEYHLFDVGEENGWKGFAKEIEKREVDVLINNAGILPPFASFDNLVKMKAQENCEEFEKIMKTNFMSVVYGVRYLSPIIEKSKTPAIINVSSSAGLCALPGISMYSASKSAVKNFTECLSLEKKYYVGLVCPGFTKTELFRGQVRSTESKLIDMISTSLNKMTKKIYKGINKKKKRMVFGLDAKSMDKFYRMFPKTGPVFFKKILKGAKVELFDDVFDNNRRNKK